MKLIGFYFDAEVASPGYGGPGEHEPIGVCAEETGRSNPLLLPCAETDWPREPTIDHVWPVSLYGGNDAANLRVLCKGCNNGKEDFLAKDQMRPFVGLPRRPQLAEPTVVPWDVFYAQLSRAGACSVSGRQAMDTELTIELVDPLGPHVMDNLRTVESKGI